MRGERGEEGKKSILVKIRKGMNGKRKEPPSPVSIREVGNKGSHFSPPRNIREAGNKGSHPPPHQGGRGGKGRDFIDLEIFL